MEQQNNKMSKSRTPPGVRELKRRTQPHIDIEVRRTPPGVRELKLL